MIVIVQEFNNSLQTYTMIFLTSSLAMNANKNVTLYTLYKGFYDQEPYRLIQLRSP